MELKSCSLLTAVCLQLAPANVYLTKPPLFVFFVVDMVVGLAVFLLVFLLVVFVVLSPTIFVVFFVVDLVVVFCVPTTCVVFFVVFFVVLKVVVLEVLTGNTPEVDLIIVSYEVVLDPPVTKVFLGTPDTEVDLVPPGVVVLSDVDLVVFCRPVVILSVLLVVLKNCVTGKF